MASSRRTARRALVAFCVPVLVALGPTAAMAAPQNGGPGSGGAQRSASTSNGTPQKAGPHDGAAHQAGAGNGAAQQADPHPGGPSARGKSARPKHGAGAPRGKAKGQAKGQAATSSRTPASAQPNQGGGPAPTPREHDRQETTQPPGQPSVLWVPDPVVQRPQDDEAGPATSTLEVPAPRAEPSPPATSPAPAPQPVVAPGIVDAQEPASPASTAAAPVASPPRADTSPQADTPVVARPPAWPRTLGEGLGNVLQGVGQTLDRVVPEQLGPIREPLAHLVPLLLAVLGAFLALQRGIGRGLGHVPMVAGPVRRHTVIRD